MTKLM